jgi:hypothetical protein
MHLAAGSSLYLIVRNLSRSGEDLLSKRHHGRDLRIDRGALPRQLDVALGQSERAGRAAVGLDAVVAAKPLRSRARPSASS